MHCVLRNVLVFVFYASCLPLCFTLFFVIVFNALCFTLFLIVFYTLRFTNRVLPYYMFPPVACRRNTRQAKILVCIKI
ncbi:hypothetical protein Hanom_Chr01g00005151 [Helianthus anomalus]